MTGIIVLIVVIFLLVTFNLLMDPARFYWRKGDDIPEWVIRKRKLVILREAQKKDKIRTLVVGDSRIFNMDADKSGFPESTFNFSSTVARIEDALVCYRLTCRGQSTPPDVLIVGVTAPLFHPSATLTLEAYLSDEYSNMLREIGAIEKYPSAFFRILFSTEHYQRSFKRLRYLFTAKQNRPKKFFIRENGFATWTQAPGESVLRRHLRAFPFTGLMIKTYDSVGKRRKQYFEKLLEEASENGTVVIVFYLPGGHPDLTAKIKELDGDRIYVMLRDYLKAVTEKHNVLFMDYHNLEALGFTKEDFMDGIHPTTDAQRIIVVKLYEIAKREGLI
jgi:hypothetical protein